MLTIREMRKLGFKVIKYKNGYKLVKYKGKSKEVVIPYGVAIIGIGAFIDKGITKVTFPKSLVEIDRWAFENNYLTEIYLKRETLVNEGAFDNNRISKVNLENVNVSGHWIFRNNPIQEVIDIKECEPVKQQIKCPHCNKELVLELLEEVEIINITTTSLESE